MVEQPSLSPSSESQQTTLFEWLTACEASEPALVRQGRLAAVVILISALVTIMAVGITVSRGSVGAGLGGFNLSIGVGALVLLAAIFYINRIGATLVAGTALATLLLGINLAVLGTAGPLSPVAVALAVPIIVAGLLGPPTAALALTILACISYFFLNVGYNEAYVLEFFSGGVALQTGLVYLNLIFVASMSALFSRTTRDAIAESQELSVTLSQEREEIKRRLELQTRYLQATVQVARLLAGERDFERLLENAVRLIRDTFGYYHVQVFIVEQESNQAVLRQSTGEIGQMMLERGHQVNVGEFSMIGQVTGSGRPLVVQNVRREMERRPGGLLPRTRSAVALPLIISSRVVGALDLQSINENAFPEESLPTLQSLADQLSIALENARLHKQTEDALRELSELTRESSRRSWQEFFSDVPNEDRRQVYGSESRALGVHRSSVVERVLSSGQMIASTGRDGRQAFLAAPIVVRNEIVGVIGVEPDGPREWTRDETRLLQGITERTALAVENARLYLQASRSAERERLINIISTRLQRAPSLELLLETAVRELAEALGTENVYSEIRLSDDAAADGPARIEVEPHQPAGEEATAPTERYP